MSSLSSFARIVWTMGWSDFRLKYRQSVRGYLWSFGKILLRFLVILHVAGPFVQESIAYYPLYLFLGLIVWEFFVLSISECLAALRRRRDIVQSIPVPSILYVLAAMQTTIIIFCTHLAIFYILLLAFGPPISWGILYAPLVFLQMIVLFLGVGLLLSAYVLEYHDIQQLWVMVHQMFFWLTPIFYPYATQGSFDNDVMNPVSLSVLWDLVMRFQPLAILLHDMRRAVLFTNDIGIPTFFHAAILTIICSSVFVIGVYIFQKRSPLFPHQY